MDFCAGKRNQFSVRIDMPVFMVGSGVGGSGGLAPKETTRAALNETFNLRRRWDSRMKCSRGRANCLDSLNDFQERAIDLSKWRL